MIARIAWPLALLALTAAVARPREVPAGIPDGKPQSCIPIVGLQSKVRDDSTIDFFVGRTAYRSILPNACPNLGFSEAFSYSTSLSQLCSSDIITVIDRGMSGNRGASCGLGPFQPMKGLRP